HRAPGAMRHARGARDGASAPATRSGSRAGVRAAAEVGPRLGSPEADRVAAAAAPITEIAGAIELRLSARPPFEIAPLLSFLRLRAIPGVEQVTSDCYFRSIRVAGAAGTLAVRALAGADGLGLGVRLSSPRALLPVATRVNRMFDLDADPAAIASHLRRDPALARVVPRTGVRMPGAWDPFEASVRALLGQQISVAAARTLAGRLVRLCGAPL